MSDGRGMLSLYCAGHVPYFSSCARDRLNDDANASAATQRILDDCAVCGAWHFCRFIKGDKRKDHEQCFSILSSAHTAPASFLNVMLSVLLYPEEHYSYKCLTQSTACASPHGNKCPRQHGICHFSCVTKCLTQTCSHKSHLLHESLFFESVFSALNGKMKGWGQKGCKKSKNLRSSATSWGALPWSFAWELPMLSYWSADDWQQGDTSSEKSHNHKNYQ